MSIHKLVLTSVCCVGLGFGTTVFAADQAMPPAANNNASAVHAMPQHDKAHKNAHPHQHHKKKAKEHGKHADSKHKAHKKSHHEHGTAKPAPAKPHDE